MELGALFKDEPWSSTRVSPKFLATTLIEIRDKKITTRSAKRMLAMKFEGDARSARFMMQEEDLYLKPLSEWEYIALARMVLGKKPDMVKDITYRKQVKKIMYFVGQMITHSPEGSVEPERAEQVLRQQLGLKTK
jgi:aspartyl-tRNA(Asn)/glutamyl-tRNA(Gln) amidotransferase subunit B